MDETASSSRTADHILVPDEVRSNPQPPGEFGQRGSSVSDNQPTVISNRDPLPVSSGSDDASKGLPVGLQPGDHLGSFELLEFIGGGGMGRVFRAWDPDLARTIALKVLPPEQAIDFDTFQRFTNEARSAARLDHESVVRVYQVGEDRGLRYIAFEFIEGVDIRALVERHGPLSLAEAVSYSLQAAEALNHAASRDVVHRDVKPSNILITPEGRVKLIDLGLARLHRESSSAADLTASGVTLGTFDYISPEQARDPRHADVRSDIYSLGCTFFYMLAGRPPFPEGTVLQKLLQHQGDRPPDIRQFRRNIPEEAVRVMRKMLAKDPRTRYQQPSELVEDLLALAEHIGLHPPRSSSSRLAIPRQRKVPFLQSHLPWLAPVAALVLIVVGLDLSWRFTAGGDAEMLDDRVAFSPDEPVLPAPESPPRIDDSSKQAADLSSEAPEIVGTAPADTSEDPPGPDQREPVEPPAGEPETPPTQPAAEPASPTNHTAVDSGSSEETGILGVEPERGGMTLASAGTAGLSADSRPEVVEIEVQPERTSPSTEPSEPSVSPAPERPGQLIVTDQPSGEHEFASLRSACAAAKTGDVILLRYSGPRSSRPISLAGGNVTVRAGKGFDPVVVFSPTEADAPAAARSMIEVALGQLTLINLALQLDVPREIPAADWALLKTNGGQSIRLEGCSLTLRNAAADPNRPAYHPGVAVFLARRAPGTIPLQDGSPAASPASIELVDCVIRGEATLLRVADAQPVDLVWRNGLLASSQQMLSLAGAPTAIEINKGTRIELRHVTALIRGGLCRMVATPQAPHLPKTRIQCYDSILIGTPETPMIAQLGVSSLDSARSKLSYHGERVFYENFDVLWEIQPLEADASVDRWTFAEWTQHWGTENESHPSFNEVGWWALPNAARAVHTHTPGDYALDDSTSNNPAIGSAGGDSDAGLRFDGLPALPDPDSAEPPSPPVPAPTETPSPAEDPTD